MEVKEEEDDLLDYLLDPPKRTAPTPLPKRLAVEIIPTLKEALTKFSADNEGQSALNLAFLLLFLQGLVRNMYNAVRIMVYKTFESI